MQTDHEWLSRRLMHFASVFWIREWFLHLRIRFAFANSFCISERRKTLGKGFALMDGFCVRGGGQASANASERIWVAPNLRNCVLT
jgi:hypothetical protein